MWEAYFNTGGSILSSYSIQQSSTPFGGASICDAIIQGP